MKTKYILIGLMMLSSLLSYAQNTFECEGLISSSMKLYEEKAFSKALTTFKKVISNKCTLTNSDYYNGACIASLAKNKILALSYLQTSINKGFDNEAHMAKDTDLDFIRKSAEYKNLIGTFAKKNDAIKKEFAKINAKNMALAIPYTVNGKWGWLHKNTLQALCNPVFDYTEFKSLNGLCFLFNSKKYIYTNDLKVKLLQELEPTNNMGAVMRSPDEPKVFSDTTLKGFETINHSVSKISNAYNNIELIYERYAQEQMAIATDKANRKAVIFQNGSVLNNFDFKFSEIDYFNNEEGQIFFITKELNQNTYKIYDKSGKLVYDKTIDGYSFYSNYQWDKIRGNVYIGYPEIFKISVGEKQNIFSKIKLTTLLPKNYDKIESINGPSDDVNREGTVGNNGLIALFFLVNDAANTFYVDEKGVEYKVKK